MTPALVRRRLPPVRVKPKLEVLPKEMPPMLRLASSVIALPKRVRVVLKVATSVLVVPEIEPGAAAVQLESVVQRPSALTFHAESAARTATGAHAVANSPAQTRAIAASKKPAAPHRRLKPAQEKPARFCVGSTPNRAQLQISKLFFPMNPTHFRWLLLTISLGDENWEKPRKKKTATDSRGDTVQTPCLREVFCLWMV